MSIKETTFQLHIFILWTINEFYTYKNLLGWSIKGKFTSCCKKNTWSLSLPNKKNNFIQKVFDFCHLIIYSWRNNIKVFDDTKKNYIVQQFDQDSVIMYFFKILINILFFIIYLNIFKFKY